MDGTRDELEVGAGAEPLLGSSQETIIGVAESVGNAELKPVTVDTIELPVVPNMGNNQTEIAALEVPEVVERQVAEQDESVKNVGITTAVTTGAVGNEENMAVANIATEKSEQVGNTVDKEDSNPGSPKPVTREKSRRRRTISGESRGSKTSRTDSKHRSRQVEDDGGTQQSRRAPSKPRRSGSGVAAASDQRPRRQNSQVDGKSGGGNQRRGDRSRSKHGSKSKSSCRVSTKGCRVRAGAGGGAGGGTIVGSAVLKRSNSAKLDSKRHGDDGNRRHSRVSGKRELFGFCEDRKPGVAGSELGVPVSDTASNTSLPPSQSSHSTHNSQRPYQRPTRPGRAGSPATEPTSRVQQSLDSTHSSPQQTRRAPAIDPQLLSPISSTRAHINTGHDASSDTLSETDSLPKSLKDLVNAIPDGPSHAAILKANEEELARYTTPEQIQNKIRETVRLVKAMHGVHDCNIVAERKKMVDLIVLLKLKLQEMLTSISKEQQANAMYRTKQSRYKLKFKVNTYGHILAESRLIIIPGRSTFCEVCTMPIILNRAEQCQGCNIYVHEACSHKFTRPCAKTENPEYIKQLFNFYPFSRSYANLNATPETLYPTVLPQETQAIQFSATFTETRFDADGRPVPVSTSCHECKSRGESYQQMRRCALTGYHYCKNCHWDDRAVIPANILYNWDFTRLPVCRRSLQILKLFATKPLINISKCNNGQLFRKIKRLGKVHRLRRRLMDMYEYIGKCKLAKNDRILQKTLKFRASYFMNDDLAVCYSIQDLVECATGRLYRELKATEQVFDQHIRQDCLICRGRGHICKICWEGNHGAEEDEPLFPFDTSGIRTCGDCGSVYHEVCFTHPEFLCVTCLAYRKRQKARKEELPPEPQYADGISSWRRDSRELLTRSFSVTSLGTSAQTISQIPSASSFFTRSISSLHDYHSSRILDNSYDQREALGVSPAKSNTLWSVAEDDEEDNLMMFSAKLTPSFSGKPVASRTKVLSPVSPRDENRNRVAPFRKSGSSPLGFQHPYFKY